MDVFDVLQEVDEEPDFRLVRIIKPRIDPINFYSDTDFYKRFRMNKHSARLLIELVGDDLETQRLSGSFRVLSALHTLTAGCMQSTTGDVMGISQGCQSRTLKRFLDVLLSHRHTFIKFPNDLVSVKLSFQELRGMPNIIGAIDGTHIQIKRPSVPNAEIYYNRKSQLTINTQVVAGADLRFYHVVARWAGSTHDSRIFRSCTLMNRLQTGDLRDKGYLLGDKGYPSMGFLLTPIRENSLRTPEDRAYNRYVV